jgi:hypothetical protein
VWEVHDWEDLDCSIILDLLDLTAVDLLDLVPSVAVVEVPPLLVDPRYQVIADVVGWVLPEKNWLIRMVREAPLDLRQWLCRLSVSLDVPGVVPSSLNSLGVLV